MVTEPHWTAYASALLVPVVAVLGLVIAYRQWRTAHNKLKLDLFQRRFLVYEAARQLISDTCLKPFASQPALAQYSLAALPARWLFDKTVADYLDTRLYVPAARIRELTAKIDRLANQPAERLVFKTERDELRESLLAETSALDAVFEGFLTITH